jgi:ATP-dependent DNA helicase RecG
MSLSDGELLNLLTDLESDRVERKQSLGGDAPKKLRQAICAFSNDLPNHRKVGIAFVGVDDAGIPTGLKITDNLLLQLADMKSDGNIVPPPSMNVEKRTLRGQEVAVVTTLPSDAPPIRYDGRIWIRTGPRLGIASKQDEQILNEKRRFNDLPFDIQPVPSSVLEDLEKSYYEAEYLPATVARDVLEGNDRTYPQRLASSKMILASDETTPTVLGHVVIGVRTRDFLPGSYVQFLKFNGLDLASEIIDAQEIDGRLADIARFMDEKIRAHNFVSVDFKSGDVESRRQPYPMVALQQLIRNALLHRSYENTNAPVKVSWFLDRIEIWSPGGPFGVVTAETFAKPGYADYRNPHIAEAMKGLGLVQRFGVGIQTALRELEKNGNPAAEFQVASTAVNVVIKKS